MSHRSLSPEIQARLSKARTRDESVQIWIDHPEALQGHLFVLSIDDAEGGMRWPARLDLANQGFLRSVFRHSNLWFVSHDILAAMFGPEQNVNLPVDYTIGFDINAAEFLRAMIEGRNQGIVEAFRSAARQLAGRRFNWDLGPYLMERAARLRDGEAIDLECMWRTVVASERFGACDQAHFAKTGEIVPQISENGILRKAQDLLAGWDQQLKYSGFTHVREQHRLFYLMALQMAWLEQRYPGRRSSRRKLVEFIAFMDREISAMFHNIIWAAGRFFELGGQFRPLSKLTSRGKKLLPNAENVAWDLHHFTMRRDFVNVTGYDGAFLVPYFLTFDRGLAELLDGFPQRSCLLSPHRGFPQFFGEVDFDRWLIASLGQSFAKVRDCFTIEGAERRRERGFKIAPAAVEEHIKRLERTVAAN